MIFLNSLHVPVVSVPESGLNDNVSSLFSGSWLGTSLKSDWTMIGNAVMRIKLNVTNSPGS